MLNAFLVVLVIVAAVIALGVWYSDRQPSLPPLRSIRNVEPTPGVDGEPEEPADYDRPTNPAHRAPDMDLDEVLAVIRSAHQTANLPLVYGAGYAPTEPDEVDAPVEDVDLDAEEEPEPVLDVVLRVGAFSIQSPESTEPLVAFGESPYPVAEDEKWKHTGFTGFIPRVEGYEEPADNLDAHWARHNGAALLTPEEVSA